MTADLTVPRDEIAERAVLGSVIRDPEAIGHVAGWLTAEHFYLEKHALIYEAMLACYHQGVAPVRHAVITELRRRVVTLPSGEERTAYDVVGGAGGIAAIAGDGPTPSRIAHYAEEVEAAAVGRALVETGAEITILGYDTRRPIGERIAAAEERLFRIGQRRRLARDFVTMAHVASETMDWLASDVEPGLPLGFPDLDDKLSGGLQPGDLCILAARPSVGKTSMALSILNSVCIEQGRPAQMFSLEMSRRQLAIRLAAMRAGLDVSKVRPGKLGEREMRLMAEALSQIALDGVLVDDTPCEHIDAMRAKARRAAAQTPPALIVVDYLGLAESDGENRVQEVSKISRHLKAMAREIGCPVLALSQLSRAVEGRAVKVPMLSDLRDSGAVEQDADQVMFLHRPGVYDQQVDASVTELHIAKNRNGPIGVVPLYFDGPRTQFRSLSHYSAPEGY